jgi:putative nucleotidyltransferase with HDIG domain
LQPSFGVTVVSSVVSPSLKKPFLGALSKAIAFRDLATWEHAHRVRRYATALARKAGIVEESLLQSIDAAALLHDVGKLAIPDGLLDKPGPLSAEEYDRVKEHAAIGADLLAEVPFPGPLAALVRHHHENWDGSGYPDRKVGTEIPLGARMLALADCYDALTSHRPYRRALSHDSAIAMIHERRGSMFDPELTDAFLQVVWQLRPPSPGIYRPAKTRPAPARSLVLVGAR